MKRRFGFIIALAVLVLGASVLSVVPVSAYTVVHGLYGRYWQDSFFGEDLPSPPGCVVYNMPLSGPYPPPTIERVDSIIDFTDETPDGKWNWRPFGLDYEFSVKWSGHIDITVPGSYWFRLVCDDGGWLFIDGTLVINHGGTHPPTAKDGSISLTEGGHEIVIDFYETCDVECGIVFYWKPPGATDWVVVPSDVLIPEPLPNVTIPEFGLALPMVISLAAAALFIGKRRWLKITP